MRSAAFDRDDDRLLFLEPVEGGLGQKRPQPPPGASARPLKVRQREQVDARRQRTGPGGKRRLAVRGDQGRPGVMLGAPKQAGVPCGAVHVAAPLQAKHDREVRPVAAADRVGEAVVPGANFRDAVAVEVPELEVVLVGGVVLVVGQQAARPFAERPDEVGVTPVSASRPGRENDRRRASGHEAARYDLLVEERGDAVVAKRRHHATLRVLQVERLDLTAPAPLHKPVARHGRRPERLRHGAIRSDERNGKHGFTGLPGERHPASGRSGSYPIGVGGVSRGGATGDATDAAHVPRPLPSA
jgi:hypothetical protein